METPHVTIWVVNESGHPTYRALELIPGAELRSLTVRNETNPLRTDRLAHHLAEGIGRFAKEGDYLLISGSPMINAMALTLWILRFGRAQIIQWNAYTKEYERSSTSEEDLRHLLDRMMLAV